MLGAPKGFPEFGTVVNAPLMPILTLPPVPPTPTPTPPNGFPALLAPGVPNGLPDPGVEEGK